MDDQFLEDVKKLKGQNKSEREIAEELKTSKSHVHDALEKLKQAEETKALVPQEMIRSIIREELERARAAEKADEKADG